MLLTASLGLMVGIPFGVVTHRGDFCMHSAFRQILEERQTSSLPAYLLALGCQLVLVNALSESQILFVPVPPLMWLAAIVGGLVFGFGMVWAKG